MAAANKKSKPPGTAEPDAPEEYPAIPGAVPFPQCGGIAWNTAENRPMTPEEVQEFVRQYRAQEKQS